MYISLKDSCAKGFRRWADAHQKRSRMNFARAGAGWSPQVLIKKPGVDITRAAASSMARAGRGDAIKQIPPIPWTISRCNRQKGDGNEHQASARARRCP